MRSLLLPILTFACLTLGATATLVAQNAAEPTGTSATTTTTAPPSGGETDPAGNLFDGGKSAGPADPAQQVSVSALGMIDLHVKDLDVTQLLQLLSLQSKRNIIASRNVAGVISADLYNVDFYDALDALLTPNGFGYRERNNFIYVYTREELLALEAAERKQVHRVYRLNYLTAADANEFVKPLLSTAGNIAVSSEITPGFQPTVGDGGAKSFAHTDTLVIRDYPENVEEILAVLADLDVRPKQVLIEATVLKSTLSEDNAFGVDLTVLADFNMIDFAGGPSGAINALVNGLVKGSAQGFQTSVGDTSTRFGTRVGIVTNDVAVFIKALDQVTDTTVLSHPKLLVLNRQRAELLIGEKLGYLSSTATETSTTQTVEFLEVGTQLTVRPFVSEDGFIRLELKPKVSTGSTRTVEGNVIPDEESQELTTNVMVRTGQTIVLGGLFKEETTIARKQTPVLGDIPVVGAAFRGQDDQVSRSEVIFLITPTIVKDQALFAAGERINDAAQKVRLGARQGLLPFSRSKLTNAHLQEAMCALRAGDRQKALWSCNLALRLDPSMVEAQRLKEELTGCVSSTPNNSMLREAVDRLIDKQLQLDAAEPISAAPAPQPTPVVYQPTPTPTPTVEAAQAPAADDAPVVVGPSAAAQPDPTPAQPVAHAEDTVAPSDEPAQTAAAAPVMDAIAQWLPSTVKVRESAPAEKPDNAADIPPAP